MYLSFDTLHVIKTQSLIVQSLLGIGFFFKVGLKGFVHSCMTATERIESYGPCSWAAIERKGMSATARHAFRAGTHGGEEQGALEFSVVTRFSFATTDSARSMGAGGDDARCGVKGESGTTSDLPRASGVACTDGDCLSELKFCINLARKGSRSSSSPAAFLETGSGASSSSESLTETVFSPELARERDAAALSASVEDVVDDSADPLRW